MRLFAGDRIKVMMDRFGFEEGQVLESGLVSGAIEIAQKRVEGFNFEIRKQLLEYDSTMNKQREVIYGLRRSIIEGEDTRELIQESIFSTVEDAVRRFCIEDRAAKDWDIDGLVVYFLNKFNFDISALKESISETQPKVLTEKIYTRLKEIYAEKEVKFGIEQIRRLERMFLLHTIDHKWKEHLYSMDRLKEGMGLRALGQRDPVVEYKREGYHMFSSMYESIHVDVAEMIFKLQPMEEDHRVKNVYGSRQEFVHQEFSGMQAPIARSPQDGSNPGGFSGAVSGSGVAEQPVLRPFPGATSPRPSSAMPSSEPKVGRNDDCPCGSGKKFKKCCGK
jgi:preprotein translocase subunit SecA